MVNIDTVKTLLRPTLLTAREFMKTMPPSLRIMAFRAVAAGEKVDTIMLSPKEWRAGHVQMKPEELRRAGKLFLAWEGARTPKVELPNGMIDRIGDDDVIYNRRDEPLGHCVWLEKPAPHSDNLSRYQMLVHLVR